MNPRWFALSLSFAVAAGGCSSDSGGGGNAAGGTSSGGTSSGGTSSGGTSSGGSGGSTSGGSGGTVATGGAAGTGTGGAAGSGGTVNWGPYPAGPYGNNVGDTIADLAWEGYVNDDATQSSDLLPYVDYGTDGMRKSGKAYGLIHISAFT